MMETGATPVPRVWSRPRQYFRLHRYGPVVTRADLLFGAAQGVYVRREDFNQQPVNAEYLQPRGPELPPARGGLV